MKIIKFFVSPVFMGILFLIFAASMAVATFIENDFGSAAAYHAVYGANWFALVLVLLAVNLVGQMITFRLYRKSRFTVFIFHLSFVLILAGAGITRYFGREGTIHIREGQMQDKYFTNEKYLGYVLKDSSVKILSRGSDQYGITSLSGHNYRKIIRDGNNQYELVLSGIIPNASESVVETPGGEPAVSLVFSDGKNREQVILRKGETRMFDSISIGLETEAETDLKIYVDSGSFRFRSKLPVSLMSMMTNKTETIPPGRISALKPMQVIAVDSIKIIPREMAAEGTVRPVSVEGGMQQTGKNVLVFNIISGNRDIATAYLWDDESMNKNTVSTVLNGNTLELSYGPEAISLPFALRLNRFILERYPGSSSPSGYKSDVVLIDSSRNEKIPYLIFMNKILKYRGYRIFQSSYDRDEKGTILSLNHDPVGMRVTYTGYGLLVLFIILSLLNKNSLFNTITAASWSSPFRKALPLVFTFLVISVTSEAQKLIPDRESAEEFGKILVQDQKGRTKPLFTLGSDILRKVARESKFDGMTPMQVFLGIYLDFDNWEKVPIIKVSDKELRNRLGIKGKMASFSDLVSFDKGGSYKLAEDVNRVYSKPPGARNKLDKEIMKVDERVNIIYMIYTGGFLKIFPLRDGSHDWGSPEEALKKAGSHEDSLFVGNVIPLFAEALRSNDREAAGQIANSVYNYQKKYAQYDLPSESKIKAEHLYYSMMIFERLFPFYATIGLIMLIGLIVRVIKGKKENSLLVKISGWLLFAGFLLHTLGIGLRWYVSGHAPMSNGYESMIFISWVTLLAGFVFSRKSPFALSATAVLASMTLMVAHLSFMDPEITNLVPVLKSYWLTLHVSVITGSYGFLGLGAVLSIIIMILMALSNNTSKSRISDTIDELTVINYRTLTLGLYFLTIGTFLGAVWANESWGRYWGWDPKETWSLVTIVIYSFVLHSRLIKGLKDVFTFSFLSLFAFSSVLMTYFGVNYYLSGMHSYASGEAAPVPAFVYISILTLIGLSVVAYLKYRKLEKSGV